MLGFQSLGEPDADPLFFFHGTPGSRLTLSPSDKFVQSLGVRIIAPDRPGYGISDPHEGRTLVDWPKDVLELANQLGIDSFAVSGESGGGPYALACAHCCPTYVTMVLLLSSPSPAGFPGATRGMSFGNRLGLFLNRYARWIARRMTQLCASTCKNHPEKFIDNLAAQLPVPDQALIKDELFRQAFIRDLQEAYRHGGDGHFVDGQLVMTPRTWGFSLSEISTPVFMWHGDEDTLVTKNMATYLATQLPRAKCYHVPGAGHLLTERQDVLKQMHAALHGESD